MTESSSPTEHAFVGKRQYGIYPEPQHECAECGVALRDHSVPKVPCPAAVNIKGEHFQCDLYVPHGGWAHSNAAAEAIWQ